MTWTACIIFILTEHFNPHEREARDVLDKYRLSGYKYFNPHEREARDASILTFIERLTQF